MTEPVSRETPPTPEAAWGVFRDRLPLAERYAQLLASEGVARGLIGPREAPRLWSRHLLNCAVVADAIPEGASVCDLGSGAGLPGLVLAVRRPDLSVTLVEPLLRRSRFLEEAVSALELDNVEVVRARAEELHGVREFDVVTARAVAPLARLVRWGMPLVRRHGTLLALKGATAADEVDEAARELRKFAVESATVEVVGEGVVSPPTRVVRLVAGQRSGLGLDARRRARAAAASDSERGADSDRGTRRKGRSARHPTGGRKSKSSRKRGR